jgi:hypothetical protein
MREEIENMKKIVAMKKLKHKEKKKDKKKDKNKHKKHRRDEQ